MSKSGIILSILGGLLVIFIGAVAMLTSTLTKTPDTFIVGEQFVEHLAAKEYDAALAISAPELRNDPAQRTALEALVAQRADILNDQTTVNLTGRGIDNELRYAYGTVSAGTTTSPLYMEFVDENGQTRVSFLSFNQDDIPTYTSDTEETTTAE